jgi:hypothetical protein
MEECNDKIKFTGYAIIETKKWNEIIKQIEMKTPNPALNNTAIFVGNDAELRKRAIEYYESEGYPFIESLEGGFLSTNTGNYGCRFFYSNFNDTIITLPEPEPKYPCMMLVSDYRGEWVEALVVCKFEDIFIAQSVENKACFHSWKYAKPLPTTTITTEELIEFYEKNTNTKVILSN